MKNNLRPKNTSSDTRLASFPWFVQQIGIFFRGKERDHDFLYRLKCRARPQLLFTQVCHRHRFRHRQRYRNLFPKQQRWILLRFFSDLSDGSARPIINTKVSRIIQSIHRIKSKKLQSSYCTRTTRLLLVVTSLSTHVTNHSKPLLITLNKRMTLKIGHEKG